MKLKKKNKYFLIVVAFVLVIGGLFGFISLNKTNKIERVLKTEYYAYLPKAAQDYIKEVYEETGEVLLTEKNKKENTLYLNPNYVTYLQLSDEEKENVSVLPNPYTVDYTFSSANDSANQNFPKSYNLENVNGNNYTSPMYDQGNLGTCWAFAMVENAESYLMIKKDEPRNVNSEKFSVRQLDYASSIDGIKDYNNPYGFSSLGKGGNFTRGAILIANGLSLVKDDYMPYNFSINKKPLYEIHNYNNSIYELNSAVELPNFGRHDLKVRDECADYDDFDACIDEKENDLFQEYINLIKDGIINYGGIYLGSNDPTGQCGAVNTDGYYVLSPDAVCFPMGDPASVETGHAMQIIGWDDDYEYSYCQKKGENSSVVDGKCASGILKQGMGAWLVKNSWGENSDAAYIYLTFESIKGNHVSFAYVTSLSKMSDRVWDNVYSNDFNVGAFKKLSQAFEKKFNNKEKIEKLKFYSFLMNQEYSVSVKSGDNTYLITDSFHVKYPGLFTIDVSNKNIFIESENFEVIITNKNNEKSLYNSVSVFTKNIDSNKLIITEDEKNVGTQFTIYSETRNIPSGSEIIYELYDLNDVKINDALQIKNNFVSANNVNSEINIIKKIDAGKYKLVQKNGEVEALTYLNLDKHLEGAGTIEYPYKIYNEEDLKYVYTNLDSYYKLENDIELTSEWVPIGTKENPFTGAFDGNNHKIINLQIDDSTLEYVGLFGYVKDSDEHQTYIKNIYLVKPNIVAKQYVGGLIGGININNTGTKAALIDSIYIIGGSVEGTYASSLVADISGYKELTINNIFSSATIKGKSHSSLIRFSSNRYNSNNGTSISNIQNIGVMLDNDMYYYKTSLISAKYSYYYNISNYISTGYSKKIDTINQFYDTPIHDIDYNYSNSGYALSRTDSTYKFPSVIKKVADIIELKNINKYSEWGEDFNTYWKINEVDGATRVPILKGVDLDYTESIEDINVEFGSDITLSDYISSELITRRLNVTTEDNDVIEINKKYNPSEAYPHEIIISPLKHGSATIHVVSDYDGFETDVTINVSKTNLTITYHNGSSTLIQNVINGTAVNLIKNTFEKDWYTFKEWNTKADGTGTSYSDEQQVTITEDLDLYAIWEENNYKISFDANGGTGSMDDQKFVHDISQKITKNTYTKSGFKFKEWNTKADGTGTTYTDEKEIKLRDNLTLYAIWEETYSYIINKYSYDDNKKYIDKIDINTTVDNFKKNIDLNIGYSIDVNYKTIENKNLLYTGSKTKIYKNNKLIIEYINIIRGEVTGDAKINYLDYVNVYNHIQKVKHPELDKKELKNEYLISADMSGDGKVNYLDYVQIYNKIKELKGEN